MDQSLQDMIRAAGANLDGERKEKPVAATVLQKKNNNEKLVKASSKVRPVMTMDAVVQAIGAIRPGNRVEIQFKEQDLMDLSYLRGMHHNGFLTVDEPEVMVMMAVLMSQSWDNPQNRIFHLTANASWDKNWFINRLARRLESVTVLG